jgi:hypothetical protein
MYTTGYGSADNSPPGPAIATQGQNGNFTANLGPGTYNNPTTLAESQSWLQNGDSQRYFKAGDLVYIAGSGWYGVEDWGGGCNRPVAGQPPGETGDLAGTRR